ncbi:CTSC (predicted) [Pycnogonum litorale]
MREALVKRGPIAVGFEITHDFTTYKSGIYHENKTSSTTNKFEETSHAVLVVGYGTDEASKMKYWIVKNSWGEQGYFRIRRGKDDLHIESMAAEATPIPY